MSQHFRLLKRCGIIRKVFGEKFVSRFECRYAKKKVLFKIDDQKRFEVSAETADQFIFDDLDVAIQFVTRKATGELDRPSSDIWSGIITNLFMIVLVTIFLIRKLFKLEDL